MTDYMENLVIDSIFRPGRAVAWVATTSYSLGALVYGNNASAAGMLFECKVAGTSGSSQPTWAAFNATTTDGTVTWVSWKVGLPKKALYVALYTNASIDVPTPSVPIEVSAPSYARIFMDPTNNNSWTTTQLNTAATSTGTSGTTHNNVSVTFPAPLENWGTIKSYGLVDALTGGNILFWTPLTLNKTVNASDPAPRFAIQALDIQIDDDQVVST